MNGLNTNFEDWRDGKPINFKKAAKFISIISEDMVESAFHTPSTEWYFSIIRRDHERDGHLLFATDELRSLIKPAAQYKEDAKKLNKSISWYSDPEITKKEYMSLRNQIDLDPFNPASVARFMNQMKEIEIIKNQISHIMLQSVLQDVQPSDAKIALLNQKDMAEFSKKKIEKEIKSIVQKTSIKFKELIDCK